MTTLYKCPKCKDVGMIIIRAEEGQDIVKECECREIEREKERWENSGIKSDQKKLTFSTFKVYNEQTEYAKTKAVSYYKVFDSIKDTENNSMAFLGQVGAGKTHLSVALALNLMNNKKIPVKYMQYRDVITRLKQSMIDKEYYHKELGRYQKAKVLLIDDLFKGKINEADTNIMFELINYRYLNNLPIIISSEFTADKLLDFDEAVGSRILQMANNYIIQFEGRENNYRLRGIV